MPESIEPDDDNEVIIVNTEKFNSKLEKIKTGGFENLHIVADFDRTLTALRSGAADGRINTTPGLLWHVMGEEYVRRAAELFSQYRPIEVDPNIPDEEKKRYMETWTRAWQNNCVELGLTQEKIKEAVRTNFLLARPRLKEFMDIAEHAKVPVLIFSAGVGNIIAEYLRALGIGNTNVHVISNFAKFNTAGICTGWNDDIVTSLTKNETHALHQSWSQGVTRRPNVLLLGDHPSDARMADGARHETVLSVGFLNGDHAHAQVHKSAFDAVVVEDVGLDFPIKILTSLEK
jgi:HAD superfamily hydrolase (TIGR01544 family)